MKLNFRRGSAFASKKAKSFLQNKKPEDFKNITIIRHAAIGDWVVTRPFIMEVKKFFPNAKITLSVDRNAMYGMPEDLVDAIHIMDKRDKQNNNKRTSILSRIRQAKELPEQDIIFDLTDSSLTLLLILFSKSKLKVGYPYRSIRRFFYDVATYRSDFVLETTSMMHQLNIFGANTSHYPLDYGLTKVQRNEQNPYIIYFAGASIPTRCWGSENFVGLIEKMTKEYPEYNHVVLKGIKDDEHFNEIYEPFNGLPNVIHQNALPIEEIYDYLGKASLVIVGDTGIRNMAIASNTPTIGIMFAMGISPLRYLPKVETHEVVYDLEFTKPQVEKVFTATQQLIRKIY